MYMSLLEKTSHQRVIISTTVLAIVPFLAVRHLFLYLGFGVNKPLNQPKAIMPVPAINQQVSPAEVAVYDRKSSENIITLQTNVQERFQRLYKENIVALENILDRNRWGSLDKKQYKEIGNKHGQIYAYNMDFSNESRLLRLYITPTKEGNAVRIRFTINYKYDFKAFVDAFEANLEKNDLLFELIPDVKKCEQIEVAIPIPDLPCNDSEAIEYLLNLYEIVMKSVKDASHL